MKSLMRLRALLALSPLKEKPAVGISAQTTVLRSDFGLDAYVPNVSDEVEIRIDVEYVRM